MYKDNGNGKWTIKDPIEGIRMVLQNSDTSSSVDVYINSEHYPLFQKQDIIDEFRATRERGIEIRMVLGDTEDVGLGLEYQQMGIEVKYLIEDTYDESFVGHKKAGIFVIQ